MVAQIYCDEKSTHATLYINEIKPKQETKILHKKLFYFCAVFLLRFLRFFRFIYYRKIMRMIAFWMGNCVAGWF